MQEEHSFAAKGVRFVWSPSEAAAEREAKRRSLYCVYVNFWPFASVMLALLFLLIADPTAVVGEVGKAGIREICILAYKAEKSQLHPLR